MVPRPSLPRQQVPHSVRSPVNGCWSGSSKAVELRLQTVLEVAARVSLHLCLWGWGLVFAIQVGPDLLH